MTEMVTEPVSYRSKVDMSGRIVLPADVRTRRGIHQGDEVILEEVGERIVVMTAEQALREAQAYFAELVPPGVSLVDELLQDRRQEAARE